MVRKYFSTEDGNLETAILIGSREKVYSDIDLSFTKKPSGDVYKKREAAAVKQSVKNILLTNKTEKPFNADFGGGLNDILFELVDDDNEELIELAVVSAIENYEPRAKVLSVLVNMEPDNNTARVRVEFSVINLDQIVTLETSIIRLR